MSRETETTTVAYKNYANADSESEIFFLTSRKKYWRKVKKIPHLCNFLYPPHILNIFELCELLLINLKRYSKSS